MIIDRHMKDKWDSLTIENEDSAIGDRIWKKVQHKVFWKKYSSRFAACAIATAACIAIAVSLWNKPEVEQNNPVNIIQLAAENSKDVILPDGTKVWLNAGSTLFYPENMDASRVVELHGDAIFDVTRTKDLKNFIINLESSYIEVKGTSFAVNTDPGKEISVILYSGAVEFVSTSNGQSVSLKPSHKLSFKLTDQSINITPSFPGIMWVNGAFYIKDAPLSSLADFVSWKYNVNVKLDSSIGNSQRMNGVIQYRETSDEVVRKFCYMLDLKYDFKGGEYRITEK